MDENYLNSYFYVKYLFYLIQKPFQYCNLEENDLNSYFYVHYSIPFDKEICKLKTNTVILLISFFTKNILF